MKVPPPLAWLADYRESMERATGDRIVLDLESTVNPLVYVVGLNWDQPPSPASIVGAWNIFQIWASKNDCVPDGKSKRSSCRISFRVIIKRRNGPDREESP